MLSVVAHAGSAAAAAAETDPELAPVIPPVRVNTSQ